MIVLSSEGSNSWDSFVLDPIYLDFGHNFWVETEIKNKTYSLATQHKNHLKLLIAFLFDLPFPL